MSSINGDFIWHRHHDMLLRYCRSLTRNPMETDDLMQHTFLKAMENIETIMEFSDGRTEAWLVTTARNAFIDYCRKEARRPAAPMAETAAAQEADFSGIVVQDMLQSLPVELRRVVELRYVEGYNSSQISEMLGVPSPTVRTRLRAAVLALRQYHTLAEGE